MPCIDSDPAWQLTLVGIYDRLQVFTLHIFVYDVILYANLSEQDPFFPFSVFHHENVSERDVQCFILAGT